MTQAAHYFLIIANVLMTGYFISLLTPVLIPMLVAFFFSVLLSPAVNLLEKIKFPRILATLIPVTMSVLFIFVLVSFLSIQMAGIDLKIGTIGAGLKSVISSMRHWISNTLHIDTHEQANIMYDTLRNTLNNSTAILNNAISFTTSFMSGFVMFIINVICLLYYRDFLIEFLFKFFPCNTHARLKRIIARVPSTINGYLLGLMTVITIIAVLNVIGLKLIGLDNALLFGVVAAILTIIPYVGILIGATLPTLFALVTMDSIWYPIGVILVFSFVQFLEGNFLTPMIVSSRISINPYAAILALVITGMFLGLIGVLLALPILAVCKIVFDEFESTRPLGFLIGAVR